MIDWTNPSVDVVEARRIGRQESEDKISILYDEIDGLVYSLNEQEKEIKRLEQATKNNFGFPLDNTLL